jgi:transcriptional regulator with XRE-family HTH domain
MSKLTGISTRQIGRMEDPTYVFVPSLSLLLRIANFFEVPVISFIQEVE